MTAALNDESSTFRVNMRHARGHSVEQLLARRTDESFAFAERIRGAKKSMLAVETLTVLHKLAAECKGPIIEIGAYIGGATLALLHATSERGNTVISVEFGVAYDHPEIPTEDSVADLRRNVEAWGLAGRRHVVLPGWSLEAWLAGCILVELAGERADMLVIDSDGFAERDFLYMHPLLNDGSLIVVDDYLTSAASSKSERIAPFVDHMIERGILCEIALLPWGTWFGELVRRPRAEEVADYHRKWRQEAWPWLAFLDQQRKEQHLPRAKEMKAKLLPFQFVLDSDFENSKKSEDLQAYARTRPM
jgi:predicted O-methyltransferase YrrM